MGDHPVQAPKRSRPMHALRLILGLVLAVGFAGCGDDGGGSMTSPDGGPPDTGPMPDAGHPMSTLFGPCVADYQCPGVGARCRTPAEGWPEGSCTVPCAGPDDRGPCELDGVFNFCVPTEDGTAHWCERRCANGYACEREGYVCTGVLDPGTGAGMCTGMCGIGLPECGPGAECNGQSGMCVATGTVPAGALHGQPCAGDTDCQSGDCAEERNGATPTGYNGGFCFGLCILEIGWNNNTLYGRPDCGDASMGQPPCALPSSSCPGDAVCFPYQSFTERDLGICLDGCLTDADCRTAEGYFCQTTWQLADGPRTFANGVCAPIDCRSTMCPTGYTCRTIMTRTGPDYVCAPT